MKIVCLIVTINNDGGFIVIKANKIGFNLCGIKKLKNNNNQHGRSTYNEISSFKVY